MSPLVGSISFYLFTFNNKLFVSAFSSRWCFAAHSFRTFPKKTKGNEDHTGNMESQRSTQASHMMMVQSGGSMANNGMKKRSITPPKKVLLLQHHKRNRTNQNQCSNKKYHLNSNLKIWMTMKMKIKYSSLLLFLLLCRDRVLFFVHLWILWMTLFIYYLDLCVYLFHLIKKEKSNKMTLSINDWWIFLFL